MAEIVEFRDGVEVARYSETLDRSNMVLSAAEARLRLKQVGLLAKTMDIIDSLPTDADIRIIWEYSTVFERLNPVLIQFCTEALQLTDDQIDLLFE